MSGTRTVGRADFVVVANRLPVDLERVEGRPDRWKRSPGGLVTALEPVLRSQDGAWVGWSGVPDVDVEPFVDDGLKLHPVRLTAIEVVEYYEGFSNGTLWPLYHDVVVPPNFHRTWWDTYVKVNQRFAEATAETAAHGATVWVQDYQLQMVPKLLRELRPDLLIGFFLHIPFPPV
ncbi:MAG: trehalose-6-phosphate synthase, partial [Mycobacteriaceae bacterium]